MWMIDCHFGGGAGVEDTLSLSTSNFRFLVSSSVIGGN